MGPRSSIVYVFLTFFMGLHLIAQAKPHNEGLLSSINLGVYYQSIVAKRGVIFYNDFDINPTIALFFFDDRLEFLGDSIGYRDFIIPDQLRLRTRLSYVNDDPLFPARQDLRNSFVDRENTFEIINSIEWFTPSYSKDYRAEIDLNWAWDIKEHHGHYLELLTKVKVSDFDFLNTTIEPQVFASLGWGQKAHNQYFYGPSSDSDGINNLSYGLWLTLPQTADRFYPIVLLSHFEVLGDKNKQAAYAQENNQGYLISFIATLGLLD